MLAPASASEPSIEPPRAPDALAAAAGRAFATLRASLPAPLWDDEAARIAHARTLAMIGRLDLATTELAGGGLPSTVALTYLLSAHGHHDAAIDHHTAAISRFPAHATAIRSSVASMLADRGRDHEALALIDANIGDEPDVELWHELRAHLVDRIAASQAPR